MTISESVRTLLIKEQDEKGITSVKIAKALNRSPEAYSKIKKGTTKLGLDDFCAICKVLGVIPWQVLMEAEAYTRGSSPFMLSCQQTRES